MLVYLSPWMCLSNKMFCVFIYAFTVGGRFHKHTFVCPMGNTLSPVVSSIITELKNKYLYYLKIITFSYLGSGMHDHANSHVHSI